MNSFSGYSLGSNQYYYYNQNDLHQRQHQHQHPLSGLSTSAGHQFPSQIHPPIPNYPPHVQQSPEQLIPPQQTHQPLQQVIHPPQAHQTSQTISHHNLNGPPFPAHLNFGPINQSINPTSRAAQYFNPTTSSHSPTSPVSSFASPTSLSSPTALSIPHPYPKTSTPRRPLRYMHY